MADQTQPPYHHHQQHYHPHQSTQKHISNSQIITIITLFPLGGLLLLLAAITLTGTIIAVAAVTPLFVIFSPVLIPALLASGLALTGFFTSGAFGVTALSSLLWIFNYFRQGRTKQRVQDTVGFVGHRARHVGHKTQEVTGRT